jgi:hypothetical protein
VGLGVERAPVRLAQFPPLEQECVHVETVFDQRLDVRPHRASDLLLDGQVGRLDRGDCLHELGDRKAADRLENLLLRGKVVVDRRLAYAPPAGDLAHARPLVALLGENRGSDVQQLVAPLDLPGAGVLGPRRFPDALLHRTALDPWSAILYVY